MHEEIIRGLHPLERKLLPHLKERTTLHKLLDASGMKEVEISRVLQWLSSKGIVRTSEHSEEIASLGLNGRKALEHGLPERRFLKAVSKESLTIDKLRSMLEPEEVNACLGILKSKGAITLNEGRAAITEQGKRLLEKEGIEERLIRKLKNDQPVKSFSKEESEALSMLKKRKEVVYFIEKKELHVEPTALGRELSRLDLHKIKTIDKLTPELLRSGEWRDKDFRRYDLNSTAPRLSRGRRHFVAQAIKSARSIWLEMGFEEMSGPMVQTSFWNFDALFTAQDHPVREMQDTFFLKDPAKGSLPDRKLVDAVKKTHENGWTTGSTGWRYSWSEEESRRNVLRTHTTCLSALTLAKLKKEQIPAKYFALGKCFRNETLDWSHLFEFNQTEGIVVDENANFRHLLGYLKAFFKKMGYEKARFRPAYFPYTEFSVEIDVFHPVHNKWFELGGAGIFRPEVVKPLLGVDVPVLAWGPGFDRIIIDYYKITDIRELYRNDLKQLREIREWMM